MPANPAGQNTNSVGRAFLPANSRELPLPTVGRTFLSAVPESPSDPELKITHRRLPHWQLQGSSYFITFRLLREQLTPPERELILNHVKSGHGMWYRLYAVVVMPDHVHLLLKPNDEVALSRITKGIKGVTARLLNQSRNTRGRVWQDESFDRIVRDQREFDEKLEYMFDNPVRAGLVDDPSDYDGWFHQAGD